MDGQQVGARRNTTSAADTGQTLLEHLIEQGVLQRRFIGDRSVLLGPRVPHIPDTFFPSRIRSWIRLAVNPAASDYFKQQSIHDENLLLTRFESYRNLPANIRAQCRAALGYFAIERRYLKPFPLTRNPFPIKLMRMEAFRRINEEKEQDIYAPLAWYLYQQLGIARDNIEANILMMIDELQLSENLLVELGDYWYPGRGVLTDAERIDRWGAFAELPFAQHASWEHAFSNMAAFDGLPFAQHNIEEYENKVQELEAECFICSLEWDDGAASDPFQLHCGHTLCERCAFEYLRSANRCPFCRQQLYEIRPRDSGMTGVKIITRRNTFLADYDS